MLDSLNHLGHCPVCNKKLRSERAVVVAETPQTTLLEADCATCATSLILTMIRTNVGYARTHATGNETNLITVIGMVTDLTAGDARRLLKERPVTVDEVLALHRHLKTRLKEPTRPKT